MRKSAVLVTGMFKYQEEQPDVQPPCKGQHVTSC